uniref:Macin n=1 Tax=Anadara broughtonii TaxID=148819 RepID=V5IYZ5_ANABR|nr:macin [Anadara broughtonii]
MARATLMILLVSLCVFTMPSEGFIVRCFKTWSRCSRWSSWIPWKGCNARCKELGRSGGNCVLTNSNCPFVKKAYQCQCY